MNAKHRLANFRAMVKDHSSSTHYFEEIGGERRQWKDLSPDGKLEYIARDAALCDVPFERFAEAVRELIGQSVIGDAALRTVLRNANEARALEGLLPPERGTESRPLIDRFKEILHEPSSQQRENGRERSTGKEIER